MTTDRKIISGAGPILKHPWITLHTTCAQHGMYTTGTFTIILINMKLIPYCTVFKIMNNVVETPTADTIDRTCILN